MNATHIKTRILWGAVIMALTSASAQGNSIITSVHNLSVSGPGPVKATTQTEICIFCHTPHNARPDIPYLWNRRNPAGPYTPYYSTTIKPENAVGQPTGASRLCLSCHDGTIAPGAVLSQTTEMPFAASMTGRSSILGTNLADDHPVSFNYADAVTASNNQLVSAGSLPSVVRLDAAGQMQCTACHNPHNDQYGKFLVMPNLGGALCVSCHSKTNWGGNSHATSTKTWNGAAPDPWPTSSYTTVAANGCGNCHRPHTAASPQRLLNYAVEGTNCLVCHNGNVATKNIGAELTTKTYRHPVSSPTGVHDAAENYALSVSKHVECVDCHNPHQVNNSPAVAPLVPGRLQGVPGVKLDKKNISSSINEYEICLKCHGSPNNVKTTTAYPRVVTQTDNWLKFATSNASFHPVLGPRNSGRSTLLSPLTSSSVIYCTDCHNNDSLTGPRGPHGSKNKHILVREFETSETPATTYNEADYALCFGCHDKDKLFGSGTKFKQHTTHVKTHTMKDRCVYCHDPHGSQNNPGLINFNLRVVSADGIKPIEYKFADSELSIQSCVLVCHGTVHGGSGGGGPK